MKFKFSKDLDYQLEAIEAVVNILDTGKNLAHHEDYALRGSTKIVPNDIEIDKDRIFANLQSIQKTNNIKPVIIEKSELSSMDFSVEMETGTGKTYVYLRTIHELYRTYGLRKFIILVPSVAIREGVAKSIQQMRNHFHTIYNFGFGSFVYDSDQLSLVREFTQAIDLQIMVMTVQSFKGKDNLVMRQTPDRFHGERPIDLIAETHPVVIMDEPQNMESQLSKEAIVDLKPLFKLRYSATHREVHNLVYRLTPVEAYRQGLVKRIAVWGVEVDDAGAFQFRVNSVDTKKGSNPTAKVLVEVKSVSGEYAPKEIILHAGDDLMYRTHNPKYQDIEVRDIDANYMRVELSDGSFHSVEDQVDSLEEIFRTQIHETIKAHMNKQTDLGEQIKVLSLFFIDKVDNYMPKEGLIRQIFSEVYTKLQSNYPHFRNLPVDTVHKGYFASKKTKGQIIFQDTSGKTKADKDAYNLIMRDKERLLSFQEPVSFIFSHSALKEGWDNPNVFQICTLREVHSQITKRQEIGRGLRLPRDRNGDMIYDNNINTLTVIANESYQQYAGTLQREFTEAGYSEGIIPDNARAQRIIVGTNNKQLASTDFHALWERISQKTKYNIEVHTDKLISEAVENINDLNIHSPRVTVSKGQLYFDDRSRVMAIHDSGSVGGKISHKPSIPNILNRLASETGITKSTIFQILSKVNNLKLLHTNHEEYLRSLSLIIQTTLHSLLINEGLKYIPTGDIWELSLFQPFEALEARAIQSQKSTHEYIVYDSEGERQFAHSLENSNNVIVYSKLPRNFKIDTPLGEYNPDWAIVWQEQDNAKLYLVRETKFGYKNLFEELSLSEKQKILCAQKHFKAISFDNFKVSEKQDLSDILEGSSIEY